jgi:hypothetical protein
VLQDDVEGRENAIEGRKERKEGWLGERMVLGERVASKEEWRRLKDGVGRTKGRKGQKAKGRKK